MATQTTNYGLKKPSYSDTADIGVINSNMDIIDAKMKEIDDKAGSGGGGTSVIVDSELSTTSENPVQNKVITPELNKKGTYSKPTGGIPKTDLANEVQTSLGKADTALQEHQDISGKADKTELTALYNSISDAWDSATAYTVGQYCIYNNALWKCLVANTNTEPIEGTHWTKVSVANEIASVNSSLSDVSSFITEKNSSGVYCNIIKIGKQRILSIYGVGTVNANDPIFILGAENCPKENINSIVLLMDSGGNASCTILIIKPNGSVSFSGNISSKYFYAIAIYEVA